MKEPGSSTLIARFSLQQERDPARMPGRQRLLLGLLLVALLHGGLYASTLPPWGVIDEQQHVHYIQYLAEQQAIPTVGQTYLSHDIITSLFDTQHWQTFHWPTPDSQAPQDLGLEGHSYEGYQPPLFYVLMDPLYRVFDPDILTTVYVLRWVTVGLSLVTVWIAYRMATELFPENRTLPYLVALFLILLPERTAAVSRVNNDVLLELLAAAFLWVCTQAIRKGLSTHRSQLLGLLLGLGLLTKTSMAALIVPLVWVFWSQRHSSRWLRYALWATSLTLLAAAPLVGRNLWLYGDPLGIAGFEALWTISAPALTAGNVLSALQVLFRHFWLVWWKGAAPATNPLLRGVTIWLLVLTGFSAAGMVRVVRQQRRARDPRASIVALYLLALGSCSLAVLVGYFQGIFGVIQGRFLLPASVPVAILFMWGLWANGRRGTLIAAALLTLAFLDGLSLFGNLLPYYYYWSAFVIDGVSQPYTWPGLHGAWAIFVSRFFRDKPSALRPIAALIPFLYGLFLLTTASFLLGRYRRQQALSSPTQGLQETW